ncbi:integrase core domain-containing protein [Pseudarthrobacter siccitolerans]
MLTTRVWSPTATGGSVFGPSAVPSLTAEEAAASAGSKGDSYDNAMAETLNSLFKAELVRNKGPWRDVTHLEVAVAEWADWYNHRRLHGESGHVPTAEYEQLRA